LSPYLRTSLTSSTVSITPTRSFPITSAATLTNAITSREIGHVLSQVLTAGS